MNISIGIFFFFSFKIYTQKSDIAFDQMVKCYCKMLDFGRFHKMIKISEKVDKPNIDNGFNISFFIGNWTSSIKTFQ